MGIYMTNSRCVVFTNSKSCKSRVQSAYKFVLQKSSFFKALTSIPVALGSHRPKLRDSIPCLEFNLNITLINS
jgi:hypothetical protein